jgi:Holliday junction DNA helicase RuvA
VVIDVGGVGYKVHPPIAVIAQMPRIGEEVSLLISTVVREESITCYGFADDAQQGLFEVLLSVSGVGPKVALNILSVLPVEQIVSSIRSDNFRDLNRVPGVGTKTAQRIVLELKEKITKFVWAQAAREQVPAERRTLDEAVEGLITLGYNRNDARSAAEEAMRSVAGKDDTSGVVTAALKLLARG